MTLNFKYVESIISIYKIHLIYLVKYFRTIKNIQYAFYIIIIQNDTWNALCDCKRTTNIASDKQIKNKLRL